MSAPSSTPVAPRRSSWTCASSSVRDAGRLLTADIPRLIEVVNEPLPTTVLVLVAGGGTIPAAADQGDRCPR